MFGKILKVFSNDLNGNVDDRKVAVFGAFNHLKYMNRYVIFAFIGEYDKKELYYGSVHQAKDSLLVFSTPDSNLPVIDEFINEILNNNINQKEYEVLDISSCKKIELISYNKKEFEHLFELDKLTIKEERPKATSKKSKKKSSAGLYFLLVLFIILGLGVTYIYFNPSVLDQELKQLNCTKEDYDEKLEMNYHRQKIIKFDAHDEPVKINNIDTYTFSSNKSYQTFKESGKESTYFKNGEYKYDDAKLELKIFTEEKTIINNYEEMKKYLTKEEYSCLEEKYYG